VRREKKQTIFTVPVEMINIESAADNVLKLIADPKYWWYHSRF